MYSPEFLFRILKNVCHEILNIFKNHPFSAETNFTENPKAYFVLEIIAQVFKEKAISNCQSLSGSWMNKNYPRSKY